MHIIQKVSIDSQDRVDLVQWQRSDATTHEGLAKPAVVGVVEVIHELASGGQVVMCADGSPGLAAPVTRYADEAGHEWLRVSTVNGQARTLHDLPRL